MVNHIYNAETASTFCRDHMGPTALAVSGGTPSCDECIGRSLVDGEERGRLFDQVRVNTRQSFNEWFAEKAAAALARPLDCLAATDPASLDTPSFLRSSVFEVEDDDETAPDPVNLPEERLQQFGWTITPTGCWEWNGGRLHHRGGYGQVRYEGKTWKAHRLAYEAWIGPIPERAFVCHSCDNPPCINPDHLWAGTPLDNARDMCAKGRASGGSSPGEKHPMAILTEVGVLEIRRRLAQGDRGCDIAEDYGVTRAAITAIKNRRTWRHL